MRCLKCQADWSKIVARGLCNMCYQAVVREGTRDDYPPIRDGSVTIIVCRSCGQEKRHIARGLCVACTSKHRRAGDLERFPLTRDNTLTVGVEIVARTRTTPTR